MKKCPFCAEKIQDEAIKCKHCGEWFTKPITTDETIEQQIVQPKGLVQESNINTDVVDSVTENDSNLQNKVDTLLKWGIILSLFWLAGIGSLIAIVLARRAQQIIRQSSNKVQGKGRMWWCFIIGSVGIIFWFPVILVAIINHL